MFRGSLTGRVRASWIERRFFVEFRSGRCAAVHFVGADVDEANVPKFAYCLQQTLSANNVGLEKRRSVLDAAIDMRLRGKVNHGVKPASKQFSDGVSVGDVAA